MKRNKLIRNRSQLVGSVAFLLLAAVALAAQLAQPDPASRVETAFIALGTVNVFAWALVTVCVVAVRVVDRQEDALERAGAER